MTTRLPPARVGALCWLLFLAAAPAALVGQELTTRSPSSEVVLDARSLQGEIFFLGEVAGKLDGRAAVLVSGGRSATTVRLQTYLLSARGELEGRCASAPLEAVPGRTVRVVRVCEVGKFAPREPGTAVAPGEVVTFELEPGESAVRAASRLFAKVEFAGAIVMSVASADGTTMGGKAVLLFLRYPPEHG